MANRVRFTPLEIKKIKSAVLSGHTGWDNTKLKKVKDKIKNFSLVKTYDRCCYCGRNLTDEFRMTIDIEHILPKSLFLKHMFTLKNLSVSCKRCNMKIKKSRVDFLEPDVQYKTKKFKTKYYKIIHPNLDNYDAHLNRMSYENGRNKLIKYKIINNSNKGNFTYDYFNLNAFEKDSFDRCQGGGGRQEINNHKILKMFDDLDV